jgi:hypothetical protein
MEYFEKFNFDHILNKYVRITLKNFNNLCHNISGTLDSIVYCNVLGGVKSKIGLNVYNSEYR